MAFSTGLGDRGDDLRFRNAQSPRDETNFPSITSPLRSVGTQIHAHASASNDARGTLHRRFTTNTVPTLNTPLSPIGQQRRQAAEPTELTTATYHKLQVLEKKKLEYEYLKEQRRRFEADMELLDLQSMRDEEEIHRLSSDISYGKHSQPTTPPEYNNGFPTALSRPSRFSISSVASPGMPSNRASRSGSQITSPPSVASTQGTIGAPSKSMPGSRRNSDEEPEEDGYEYGMAPMSPVYRTTNRMSMPATLGRYNYQRGRDELPDLTSVLGHINTDDFLVDDDDVNKKQNPAASPDVKSYLQMNTTDDRFPILVRRNGDGESTQLSASHAALDLALSQTPKPETQANGWHPFARHRHAQQSLPVNTLRKGSQVDEYDIMQLNGNQVETTPTKTMGGNRRSMEINNITSPYASESKRSSYHASPGNGFSGGMPKLQSSYSTNDIPTLKNGSGITAISTSNTAVNSHAEQHLHNHNVSMGRIPINAVNNRHSRELSSSYKEQDGAYQLQSELHASAAPFGPSLSSAASVNGLTASTIGSPTLSAYSTAGPYYGGYGMSMLNLGMGNMSLGPQMGAQPAYNGAAMQQMYPPAYGYNPYLTYGPGGRFQDSQARVIQSRRMQNDSNRFMNYDLKTMPRHEIYALCKDQHGCRFLQKKLEERNAEYLQIIFEETNPHVVELMTDPFGNYLCQKLLEFTTHEQRNVLVRNAAPSLVAIALNQHGTRALQKMIEFISTTEQIQTIIQAFSGQVVQLIQDLNGNHVIQKCLNHLKSEDAQFIFDAVGNNCITVGTHRHGCCVLQRCIDHASGFQKVQLVRQITANSFHLVQDPFGNYVVQYILDLNEPSFTNPLCMGFQGKIAELSKQKFSSNVIEKCIRCADVNSKRMMVEEMMDPNELEKLMRDSFGNYVIQTALEFAPPDMCIHLIESMRPILPQIRQTPYGRRIQSKVQERETRLASITGRISGHVSPHSLSTPHSPEMAAAFTSQIHGTSAYQSPPMYTAVANNYGPASIASPQPHRLSNPPLPNQLQQSVQQQQQQQSYPQFGLGPANGLNGGFF